MTAGSIQRSEIRRVQRSRCILKSKAKEWSAKVGGISKARLKPLKHQSGKLGFMWLQLLAVTKVIKIIILYYYKSITNILLFLLYYIKIY
jgi:hypothetical protein